MEEEFHISFTFYNIDETDDIESNWFSIFENAFSMLDPNQVSVIRDPAWVNDPQHEESKREVISIERLNEICPEETINEMVECAIQCERSVNKIRKLPCGHNFCSVCIEKWSTTYSNTCPTCRQIINN